MGSSASIQRNYCNRPLAAPLALHPHRGQIIGPLQGTIQKGVEEKGTPGGLKSFVDTVAGDAAVVMIPLEVKDRMLKNERVGPRAGRGEETRRAHPSMHPPHAAPSGWTVAGPVSAPAHCSTITCPYIHGCGVQM